MIARMTTGWEQAERVLAVRLDALGDVLMTSPALRAIRDSRSGRSVTLLTSPSGAAVAHLLPGVDAVIAHEAPWMKSDCGEPTGAAERSVIKRLRADRFDAAVIFTVYSQSPLPAALLCHLADIPLRLAHCRENPYHLLTDWVPEREPERLVRHEVRRQLDLVAHVGYRTDDERMRLRVPALARRSVQRRLQKHGLAGRRDWVVLHPGATAASRRYPPESFAAAARRLTEEQALTVVLTGSESEHDLIESVRTAMGVPSISFCGALELAEMAALIERAPLLIANNTGPVHLAAAVGTPVVDLYALTNPQHTPWAVPHRVLNHEVPCRHCYKSVCPEGHHDCLRRVEPAQVVTASLELLRRHEGATTRWTVPPSIEAR